MKLYDVAGIAGKAFSNIVKTAKDHGFVRIVSATDIDPIIAASILLRVFKENDIDATAIFNPPVEIEEPTIFLDIMPQRCIKELCIVFRYTGGTEFSIDSNIVNTPFSISATILKTIEDIWITSFHDRILCLVAGIDRGKDLSKNGFYGLEQSIAEELVSSNKLFYDIGFRLWGWKHQRIYKCLSRTLRPYLPGLSGLEENTVNFLSKLGFSDPITVSSADIMSSNDRVKAFATELIKIVREKSLRKRDPYEIVSRVYYVGLRQDIVDLLRIYGAYFIALALGGDILYNLLYAYLDTSFFTKLLLLYEYFSDKVSKEIVKGINNYTRERDFIVIKGNIVKRPEVYSKVFQDIGIKDYPLPIAIETGDHIITSYLELVKAGKNIDLDKINLDQTMYVGE